MKSALQELRTALASAYPLVFLVSPEEERMRALLEQVGAQVRPNPLEVTVWNCVDGLDGHPELTDPLQALAWVRQEGPQGLYLFKDLADLLADRKVLRRLRDVAVDIRGSGRFLALLSTSGEIPELLRPISYVVVSMFPDPTELESLVRRRLGEPADDEALRGRLVTALKGLSLTEADHLLRRMVKQYSTYGDEFFAEVLDEKEQISRKEGILEFVPPDPHLARLGGLDQLKAWVAERENLFRPGARREGLPVPRGVLMMGMSGCGKSLAVKVIARQWTLPLFRLDMNLVFSGVQGSAEWVFHRALKGIEAVSPAVLWIDEIEMGVAGYHEGGTGSLTRIFSAFLTWMQEHRADVFVAATANRINLLPAEIIRKGRFDQVFFIDLPDEEERKEILTIHLKRHQIDPAKLDLILLASAMRGWNGAEIEQAVASARITAHAEGEPVTQNRLLAACGKIVPLSRTMEEQIKAIRSWAKTRALPATTPPTREM